MRLRNSSRSDLSVVFLDMNDSLSAPNLGVESGHFDLKKGGGNLSATFSTQVP